MKLVVDTNILITFFWKKSTFSQIIENQTLELFSPEYALKEIKENKEEIKRKSKITEKEFNERREELSIKVNFISIEYYSDVFMEVIKTISQLKQHDMEELLKDIDFLALAIKLNCPLWSHDKLLAKQDSITIFSTGEIITIL